MLLLTNCTFDGVVYNVERVMEECLAIKPDLIFLWDEAWFAFAGFTPTYRRRTAMATAKRLQARYKSEEYAKEYAALPEAHRQAEGRGLLDERLMPDPAKGQRSRLCHAVDAQVADLAAPGIDDSHLTTSSFGTRCRSPSTKPS